MKSKKKKIIIAISSTVIIGGLTSFFVFSTLSSKKNSIPNVNIINLEQKDLSNLINSNGVVDSTTRKDVFSITNSTVEKVNVKIGDKVNKGDILCIINSDELKNQLNQLKISKTTTNLDLESAKKQLQYAKDDYNNALIRYQNEDYYSIKNLQAIIDSVETTEQNYENALDTYNNAKQQIDNKNNELLNSSLLALNQLKNQFEVSSDENKPQFQQALDISTLAYNELQNKILNEDYSSLASLYSMVVAAENNVIDYNSAVENYEKAKQNINEQHKENIKMAERALKNSEDLVKKLESSSPSSTNEIKENYSEIELLNKKIEECTVVAPVSGTITYIGAVEGNVSSGLLFSVENTNLLKINASIKEKDISNVKVGQNVIIKPNTLKSEEYSGKITLIHPKATLNLEGINVYTVEIDVISENTNLLLGMNTKISIVAEKSENVFAVPFDVIINEKDKDYIYVAVEQNKDKNKYIAKQIPVEIGFESDYDVEVISNEFTDNMKVISDILNIKNGQEIKINEKWVNNMEIIKANSIIKKFYVGTENELEILHGLNFNVNKGEFISIVGASGSGKSTLMNIIGCLDRPTLGEYFLDNINLSKENDKSLSEIRNKKIGFVFQSFNLIPRTSALKNVELPMLYAGVPKKQRIQRAKELLSIVEMEDRMSHMPNELSGGQKQRVSIARAMANDPSIILADEPTGALDSKTGRMVMDLFHKLNKTQGKTIVLITHNNQLASETDRVITLSDGHIISNVINNNKIRVAKEAWTFQKI